MSKTISVVFNADTRQFVANVDNASKAVAKASQSVAEAKNKITESFKMQMAAAKAAGASQEELAAITRRAAQMRLQVEDEAQQKLKVQEQSYLSDRYSKLQAASARETNLFRTQMEEQNRLAQAAALRNDVQSRNGTPTLAPMANLAGLFGQRFGSSAAEEAEGVAGSLERVGEAASHSVTGVQASSAAIRALEGGFLNNRRAAEVFISTIGPLSDLLQGAFPVIGAVALGAAFFKMGEEAYEAYQKVSHLTGAIKDLSDLQVNVDKTVAGFGEQTEGHIEDILTKTQGRAAALQQRLQFQSGKPINLDDFFYSKGVKDLPDDVKGNYENLYKAVAPADVPERLRKITDEVGRLQYALDFNQKGLFGESINSVGDFGMKGSRDPVDYMTARLTLAKQIQSQLQAASDAHSSGLQSLQTDISSQQEEDAKKAAQKTQEAARKQAAAAREAARQAAEAQKQAWRDELDKRHTSGMDTADDNLSFWKGKVDDPKTLGPNRADARHEAAQAQLEATKQDQEAWAKLWEAGQKDQRDAWAHDHADWLTAGNRTAADEVSYWQQRMDAAIGAQNYLDAEDKYNEAIERRRREAQEAQRAQFKASEDLAAQQATLAEKWLTMQRQAGAISRPDALAQQANIHTEQYRQQMDALQAELSRQQGLDPNSAATVEAQAAVAKAAADRQLQIMQDTADMAAVTWQGALKNANAAWVEDAEDSAKQVTQLFEQSVNSFNNTLASFMVRKKDPGQKWYKALGNGFGDDARSLGKTVATDGLKRLEAPALKALGISQADGSRGNPFWVRLSEGMSFGKSTLGGSIFGTGSGTASAAKGAQDAAQGVASLFQTAPSSDGDSAAGSGAGSDAGSTTTAPTQASSAAKVAGGIIGALGSLVGVFGGGKALGGSVMAGVAYDVGEMGREKFVPSTNGTIIPHHLTEGGDSATYNISVGHGVTPTEFHMKLQQALEVYHKRVMPAGAVAAVHNHNRRTTGANRS